ncbi:hypothetical protein [Parasitella parasitica]|uniref:ATP-dependent DNA helicase n=1 Tax=Parasitella parasitica TaxID=35722 RepID=A0A0B7N246_9FUNG|nr:hypothetical protein [Parasitella parasitica]
MGLLGDDNEWSATMTEASLHMHPRNLRELFCILLVFSDVSDPYQLWLDHKSQLAEDYLYQKQQEATAINQPAPAEVTDEMFGHCLLDMNDFLSNHRFDLKDMESFKDEFPTADTRQHQASTAEPRSSIEQMHTDLYTQALEANNPDLLPFNESQRIVYETIRNCALNENTTPGTQSNAFFIDGPGGTGKTFCINALLNAVRRNNAIAIAVASSGTAALLLNGGRTAHSTFKIPLDISSSTMCDITPRCDTAKLIQRAKLIIWDECSMVSKDLILAVDRTFQDIMKNTLLLVDAYLFLPAIFGSYFLLYQVPVDLPLLRNA